MSNNGNKPKQPKTNLKGYSRTDSLEVRGIFNPLEVKNTIPSPRHPKKK
jgi:hypothetical protein